MRRMIRTATRSSRVQARLEPLESRSLLSAAINSALGFGGAGSPAERITGMVTGADGTTYIAGTFTDSMDADPSPDARMLLSNGGVDVFIGAYRNDKLIWAKSYGSFYDDTCADLILLNQNNLVIGGSFTGDFYLADWFTTIDTPFIPSNGGTEAYVARISTLSGIVNGAHSFGGADDDAVLGLSTAIDAPGYYVHGTFTGTADLDPASSVLEVTATTTGAQPFISRISAAGTLDWVNTYSYDNALTITDLYSDPISHALLVAGDFNGNVDLGGTAGGTPLSSAGSSAFVARLAPSGATQWAKAIGPASTSVRIHDLNTDNGGNILLAGEFAGNVDIDPSAASKVASETAGGTGFLLKLDPQANYVWGGALLGDSTSSLTAIAADSAQNVFITGSFSGTMDLHLGATTSNATASHPDGSAFVAKYDASGAFLWERHTAAPSGASTGVALSVNSLVAVTVAGHFEDTATFTVAGKGFLPASNTTFSAATGGHHFLLSVEPRRDATSVHLSRSHSNPLVGQQVTLTAQMNTLLTAPGGTINFYVDDAFIGSSPVGKDFSGSFTWIPATTGNHILVARYTGDSNYTPASSDLALATVPPNSAPIGNLDSAARGSLVGWVADLNDPATPLVVQVLIDGELRTTFVAKTDRGDLQAALGNGAHGFNWQLPPLAPGAHTVTLVTFDPVSSEGRHIASATVTSDSLYFDQSWYLANNPDVAQALGSGTLASAWQHFELAGAREGRNASALFNESWYRAHNPEVAAAIAAGGLPSGFLHFTVLGAREGRSPSPFFSETAYRLVNPDVNAAVTAGGIPSAFAHYLAFGLMEGRSPTPWFDPVAYKVGNADVHAAVDSGRIRAALDHFLAAGIHENRTAGVLFNEAAYLDLNADVKAAVVAGTVASGLDHFASTGLAEGRRSIATFNSAAYLAAHPEAQTAIDSGLAKSPFHYYLLYGRLAGHTI